MVEPDSIVLEHLRHIRGVVDGTRDDIREIKQRVGSLENQYAIMSNRLDRMASALSVSSGVSILPTRERAILSDSGASAGVTR